MMAPGKRGSRLLLIASIALAGLVGLEKVSGPFLVPDPATGPSQQAMLADAPKDLPLAVPPLSKFAAVVERPLFNQSRRPAPREANKSSDTQTTASLPPPPKLDNYDLVGVIISADKRMALLRPKAKSEIVRVSEGQSVGGWQVRTIQPLQVELSHGQASQVLKIEVAKAGETGNNPRLARQTGSRSQAPASSDAGMP